MITAAYLTPLRTIRKFLQPASSFVKSLSKNVIIIDGKIGFIHKKKIKFNASLSAFQGVEVEDDFVVKERSPSKITDLSIFIQYLLHVVITSWDGHVQPSHAG